jgi:hypothetical protein
MGLRPSTQTGVYIVDTLTVLEQQKNEADRLPTTRTPRPAFRGVGEGNRARRLVLWGGRLRLPCHRIRVRYSFPAGRRIPPFDLRTRPIDDGRRAHGNVGDLLAANALWEGTKGATLSLEPTSDKGCRLANGPLTNWRKRASKTMLESCTIGRNSLLSPIPNPLEARVRWKVAD